MMHRVWAVPGVDSFINNFDQTFRIMTAAIVHRNFSQNQSFERAQSTTIMQAK